ncbi:MAG: hypothetical protein FWE85_02395 [Clostridiales bacterium]|nr:hypothetical protein [Clostridiales bacterium]
MIFLAVTKPKKKADTLFKVLLVLLLLGVLVPSFYNLMLEANSLERFAAKEDEPPGASRRVEGEAFDLEEMAVWQELKTVYQIR